MNPVILGGIVSAVKSAIGSLIPDGDKPKVDEAISKMEAEIVKYHSDVAKEDAVGNWLQRSYRPLIMLGFGFTLVLVLLVNFVLFPLMNVFGKIPPFIVIPVEVWDLLEGVMIACCLGRSAEKITKFIRRK